MPAPPPPFSSPCRLLRHTCFLLAILSLLSSARRCAPLAVSIHTSSQYSAPTAPPWVPSPQQSEEARPLRVGDELMGETMPLRHGRRLYRLAGLRPHAFYEVKISYPASIPSSFSIRLVNNPDAVEDWGSKNRRLLNTEKIIFKAESTKPVYVLVTVEPEGVVAKPNVSERELALFNIVCDELLLGIPHFAWWVGITALISIVLASLAPHFLPLHRLLNYEAAESSNVDAAKIS